MPLWRCVNPNCDRREPFEAADGRCPACRLPFCARLVPTHYMVPAEGPIRTGLGNRMIACDPRMATLPESATATRTAVTCPKCLASTVFAEDERDGIDNHLPLIEGIAGVPHQ